MRRRNVLGGLAAASVAPACLARPALAQPTKVLRFIPESDVAVIDPIWTTATVTRNHGYLVFDTLYGQTARYDFQPQMVAGHTVEAEGRLWRLTLREGLRFHDGEPVLARDAVASIRRFAARDAFARALMEATDELTAASDREIVFRLKRPLPLLPAALGKTGTSMPCIMPERLAKTDPNVQVTEMVGSGPFRFKADERVPGALTVYERFDGYVPRPDGTASFTAGPKRAHFDRVEWRIVPDASTAASALAAGEVDWWQNPTPDLQGLLRSKPGVRLEVLDPVGGIGCLRFNHLHPPFDNPAIRRALLGAIDQTEFMSAVAGDERALWKDHVGVFCPDAPMATRAGTEVLVGPRDFGAVKRALTEAGYRGERVVMLDPSDYPATHPLALVAAEAFQKCGLNVDLVAMDWGTLVQRRASRQPPDKGGWSTFVTYLNGTNNFDPAGQLGIRGNGDQAWFGWPRAPRLEELRAQWFAAPDPAAQKAICAEIQRQFFIDVPYLPLGAYYEATASRGLTGLRTGFPQFYDVRPA
ncbi:MULTISPECIES: ABC transporter substrate-binding protein [unclassified Methylobacterium]|uniref:ABC transporter substrate-binding protein n=1 Tax=unclassified Methylobacterium TaxID=2615210 RepID=UPI00226A4F18|nr:MULTISPECIES: ABC transporter substrate-binding protein [unclassified Methylobacterium]